MSEQDDTGSPAGFAPPDGYASGVGFYMSGTELTPPEEPAVSATEQRPAELARAVELVAAAFAEAMREHGLLPGTALVIRTAAEVKLTEVLDADEPDESS